MTLAFSMWIFALTGAVSPGPVNIIATTTGSQFGVMRALPFVLGATVAYVLVVVTVGLSMAIATHVLPAIEPLLTLLGSAYLLYIAYRIAVSAPFGESSDARLLVNPASFMDGFLTQVLNPKAWLVAMSGIGLFVTGVESAISPLLLFSIISFIACFTGVGTWACAGHLLRPWVSGPVSGRIFNSVMALLLVTCVLWIWIG
ncbi:LysE family translocator [Neptunomonas sp. XY-337]|uniref:LysE family translocator n=1 Tax=Neptunomonas sp. XY-337 TaxID=2561897 RepID=UPI0010AB2533|nr:LysE family translocator [Neptunomonas sp. XY-337]